MSNHKKKEIVCPNCGVHYFIEINPSIDNAESPLIKESILNESFFTCTCERCHYVSQMLYPLLYTDLQKNYCIAFTPMAGKADSLKTGKEFVSLTKRRVKSATELKEKILIFDNQLNDIAVELSKTALCALLSKENENKHVKAYFSSINKDGDLVFAILIIGEKEYSYRYVNLSVYNKALEVLKTLDLKPENEFLRVGPTLAQKIINDYEKL